MNFCCRAKPLITLLSSRFYGSATVSDQTQNLLHCLNLSLTRHSPKLTRQSHARIFVLGLQKNPFLATKLISAYPKLADSRLVFDSVEPKNVYLWNTLINCYVKRFEYTQAFELFGAMGRGDSVTPDDFTLATLAKASGETRDLAAGKSVHGKSVRIGFGSDFVVSNSLVSMYFKCGEPGCARKLFDEMPVRNAGSWNALIAGYLGSGDRRFDREIWEVVKFMQLDGVKPDGFTVSSLLPLCGFVGTKSWPDYGREIHCYVVKNQFDSDLGSDFHLGSCLIDMYSKSNRIVEARKVFDKMKKRNVYSWTAIINGYADIGDSDEAFCLFRDMQEKDGVEPNRVSLVSLLPACNSNGSLMGGKQIHGFAIRKLLNCHVSLCNALIDMYSKCGNLDLARRVFEDETLFKDSISWSSMISGYGLHGRGLEAASLFDEMLARGIKPNPITIVGLLSACGRSGLVDKGLDIYSSMISTYEIEPTVEICACVVDMLGRSGKLNQALEFIERMPVKPGPSVWGSLVNASIMHGNLKMQELAYRFLIELEPENPSNFVALSNYYASSEQWKGVAEVRTAMRERGLRKEPGCSWISINSTTHCFYVADKAHPSSDSIYRMLDNLKFAMKGLSNHFLDFESDINYLDIGETETE